MDLREDVQFSDSLLGLMFALEAQYLVENALETEIDTVQAAYGIPAERASAILASTCRRYTSQLLNLALGAAKNYQEQEALQWVKRILRYAKYVPGTVDADGNLFSDADKKRMIACCSDELRLGTDPELQRLALEQGDIAEKLRQMIVLSKDFIPPTEPLDKMAGNDMSVAWG